MLQKRKYFLLISAVLLLSVGTLAITTIAGKGSNHPTALESPQPAPEQETNTNDDPWTEIAHVVNAYYANDGVRYKGVMRLLDENNGQEKVLETLNFDYSLVGSDFRYQLGPVEVIHKKDLELVVDHNLKTVVLNRQIGPEVPATLFNPDQFRKLLEEKNATAKVSRSGPEKILSIDGLQDPSIQGYRIYYDSSTFHIHKMEIGMTRYTPVDDKEEDSASVATTTEVQVSTQKEEGLPVYTYYLEVTYSEVKTLGLARDAFYPEATLLKFVNGRPELLPQYRGYTLVNQGD